MNILHQKNKIKNECNIRNKENWPLGEKCLSPNIVYLRKMTLTQPNCNDKVYFGVAEKLFKDFKDTKSWRLRKWHRTVEKILGNEKKQLLFLK